MAACIAVKHPKWGERPVLVIVKKTGVDLERAALLAFYEGKIAKWWTPDDMDFLDSQPMGVIRKILKNRLCEQFADHVLPTA